MTQIEKTPSIKIFSNIPDYFKHNNQELTLFIKYYFEWLETNGPLKGQRRINDYSNINITEDIFMEFLKKEFLQGFVLLNGVDEKVLIKNIKDFYRAKGSENAYRLLFRLLYNEEIEFYYPGEDILRASAGHWIVEKSISIEQLEEIDYEGNILVLGKTSGAKARAEKLIQYSESGVTKNDLYLSNVTGTFQVGEILIDEITEIEFASVKELINVHPGRYEGTYGFLSSDKYLQDGDFYQEFSYVIKSGQTINRYRDVVNKLVHPAGTKLFGSVLYTLDIVNTYIDVNMINFLGSVGQNYDIIIDLVDGIDFTTSAEKTDAQFIHYESAYEISINLNVSSHLNPTSSFENPSNINVKAYHYSDDVFQNMGDFVFENYGQIIFEEINKKTYVHFHENISSEITAKNILEIDHTSEINYFTKVLSVVSNTVVEITSDYRFDKTEDKTLKILENNNENVYSLNMKNSTFVGTGDITGTGFAVNGNGTVFQSEMKNFDIITVDGSSYVVSSVNSNTSLTLRDEIQVDFTSETFEITNIGVSRIS